MRYYDLERNWAKKIEPHLGDQELNDILVRDFNKYTIKCFNQTFTHGQYPREYETCVWEFDHQGREPRFWRYVKHGACHWLVNFNLRLAMLALPKRSWRILTSPLHSTVWDGDQTLFDLNSSAMDVPAQECFDLAYNEQLLPGQYMEVYALGDWPQLKYSLRFVRYIASRFAAYEMSPASETNHKELEKRTTIELVEGEGDEATGPFFTLKYA